MATPRNNSKTESTERSGVFFVYKTTSPDKDWVKNTAERLEKEGRKCFYHERDFLPGLTIIENIVRFLQRSSKVIVVLTPAFLESQWVEFETQLAKQINIENPAQLHVIPVLLEDCEIPQFLRTTTYLDVQSKTEERWWNLLQESLKIDSKWEKTDNSGGIHSNVLCKIGSIPGTQEGDSLESWLIDLCFIKDEYILVTDAKNKKLKKFIICGQNIGTMTEFLEFESRPMFLTLFGDMSAYITFPDNEFIKVVNVGSLRLTFKHVLSAPPQCGGICKLDEEKLAVCCRSQRNVIILMRDGTKLYEIKPMKGDPFQDSDYDFERFCKDSVGALQMQDSNLSEHGRGKRYNERGTGERNACAQEDDSGLFSNNRETIPNRTREPTAENEAYDTDEEKYNVEISEGIEGGGKDFNFLKSSRLKAKNDQTYFVMPNHIHATSNDAGGWLIYVGDYETKRICVIYLAEDGTYRCRSLPPLQDPRGILVRRHHVLVAAGWVRVYTDKYLSKVSEHRLAVDANHPRALAINMNGNLFALTHKGDGDEFLSIYAL